MAQTFQLNYRWAKATRVNNHLYIGGAVALSPAVIERIGFTCIINATVEAPSIFLPGVVVQKLWIKDVPETDLRSKLFDEVADLINIQNGEGGRTLVYCVAGVSRSAALVLAYLMKYQSMALREAYNLLAHQRPMVRPNEGFWKQLMDFERSIYGRNTVNFTGSPGEAQRNSVPDVYLMSTGILEECEEEEEEEEDGEAEKENNHPPALVVEGTDGKERRHSEATKCCEIPASSECQNDTGSDCWVPGVESTGSNNIVNSTGTASVQSYDKNSSGSAPTTPISHCDEQEHRSDNNGCTDPFSSVCAWILSSGVDGPTDRTGGAARSSIKPFIEAI